jgi:hypothetical protein
MKSDLTGHPLITRAVLDRLHGSECECPLHRPDLYVVALTAAATAFEAYRDAAVGAAVSMRTFADAMTQPGERP